MTTLSIQAAGLEKGQSAPDIKAVDVFGKNVSLESIISEGRDLVILFFFSPSTGEAMALKLKTLDLQYGGKELEVIALGLEEDQDALRQFAEELAIRYFVIDDDALESKAWLEGIEVLPSTFFVVANQERTIERVLKGGGTSTANIIWQVAENFFQQRKLETAEALTKGAEDPESRELLGFIYTEQGKLDEAEAEFGAIDSKTGLAAVALEQGDTAKAVELADQAPADEPYAQVVKGRALMQTGKTEEAQQTLDKAVTLEGSNWEQSEAHTLKGRIDQQMTGPDAAIPNYEKAIALDPYNVVALSNEGAAYQEKYEETKDPANLEQAKAAFEKAASIRDDEMVTVLLQQVSEQQKRANDLQRQELIRDQVKDLVARMADIKANPDAPARDDWTTRPVVLALLPGAATGTVFFERAGMDEAIRRELESKLQQSGDVAIVEREMLDQLLQELNLGSSELADATTQRQLGRVLSAGVLGFISFTQMSADPTLYLRLVDTETTEIAFQTNQQVNTQAIKATIDSITGEVLGFLANGRELKGLIADAEDANAIILNVGKKHGVTAGQEFIVLSEGEPVEVGGRVIAHRQKPVGKLKVTQVEEEYALAETVSVNEGVTLAKEMKVRAGK
jgi:tetratricopeptide (TPR) repeat protein